MKALNPRQMQFVPVKYATSRLGAGQTAQGLSFPGGLDLTTPSLSLQPGALRDGLNFECAQSGGYARIEGYERVDGRAAPSAATYLVVQVAAFASVPTVGQVISQASSGASGTIIAVVTSPTPYMAVTKVTGAFDATGTITTPGPVTIGTATATTTALSSLTDAIYIAAAADVYRALIGPVPGSGAVLGTFGMTFSGADNVYAFRANAGGTAVDLYKTSASGWVQVPFYNLVDFVCVAGAPVVLGPTAPSLTVAFGSLTLVGSSLMVENIAGATIQGELIVTADQPIPQDGDTLTQGSVSATIKRVMWQAGSWSGTATGAFVVTTPSGGNFSAGQAATSGGASITLSGPQTAITMAVGGHFEFAKGNFSGQLATRRLYGCDGVNRCFEFDGDTLAPIDTGLSPDSPAHIAIHQNFLFVAKDGSLLYSGAGTPFKWSSTDGAGEIATGDTVTDMLTLTGSQTAPALGVYLRNNTSILYGSDPATFNYVSYNTGTGALPFSAQNMFDTFAFDDLGVITLKTTLTWGNFSSTALTKNIQPFIIQERAKLTASAVNRSKSQYRVFFSDGYGLWLTTVNQQYLGAAVVSFPNPVSCVDEGEDSAGTEVSYFGSSDGLGYVYQMDIGTSFDGADIPAYITPAWNPLGSPRLLKRFRAASLEMQGSSYAQIQFGYQLGYGSAQIGQPAAAISAASGFVATPYWDSFTWDNFTWDGQTLSPTDVDMTGTAENVQVTISSGTNYIAAYTVDSIIYHFTARRGIRV